MEDYRKYLDPKILVKISRLDLIARLVVEGFIAGLHKSPYHGFSVEFAEHREYVPGDDVRHIDWKVYGKTDRYYVKQYEEETNLISYIALDTSESMRYSSGAVSKMAYGCFVAASLAYLILNQQDSVGMALFDDDIYKFLPPSGHAAHLKFLLHELNQIAPRKKTDVGAILHNLAERIKRKGLIIVISDMFDDPQKALQGLHHLRHRKHEVILFHVLDRYELEFPFTQQTRFLGLEEYPELTANPRALRKAYLEELGNFTDTLKRGCRQNRIDYVPLNTAQPLDVALTSYLATRAEMKLK